MRCDEVGAMLYISSHLTFLMLAIVPPISLGAVGVNLLIFIRLIRLESGILRPILEKPFE